MLLEWLGHKKGEPRALAAARAIDRAVDDVIERRVSLTPDLGGTATTSQMGDAIAARAGVA
jgi:isocitrate/isopropylmalate dehydrogenase